MDKYTDPIFALIKSKQETDTCKYNIDELYTIKKELVDMILKHTFLHRMHGKKITEYTKEENEHWETIILKDDYGLLYSVNCYTLETKLYEEMNTINHFSYVFEPYYKTISIDKKVIKYAIRHPCIPDGSSCKEMIFDATRYVIESPITKDKITKETKIESIQFVKQCYDIMETVDEMIVKKKQLIK